MAKFEASLAKGVGVMRFAGKCVLPLFLLLGLLMGCGPRSDNVSDADTAPATEIATTTEEPVSADEATSPAAAGQVSAPSEPLPQVVQPSGGEIVVDDPESPIDGLSITVPDGAYADSTEFVISHRPLETELPDGVSALTPLIEIDNGGAYADGIMTVTVPIDLPEDHFAMGFYLHEDGSLEGMPIVDLSRDSITIATMHFSEFFISMIADALLVGEFDTGFRPKQDDWQFENDGSYIEPGGHCAGQALSAMWYYCERTLRGAPSLYGRYDNNGGPKTPKLWQDDSRGYRLASVVQHDIDFDNWLRQLNIVLGETSEAINWRAFLYAMLVTGEPQYVGIYNDSGHAMIVYKANADTGTLYIADPNFPGDASRTIRYANGKFSPYVSGDSTSAIEEDGEEEYTEICYFAKSAIADWPRIAARWAEFDAGTIGDDLFPSYELVCPGEPVPDHAGTGLIPLVDGMPYSKDRMSIFARGGEALLAICYSPTGQLLALDENHNLLLQPGENRIGLEIRGLAGPGSGSVEYVDFRWLTIDRVTEEVQLTVEVQVHADIRRVNVPDPSAGFEGQTLEHDTPFEKVKILSYEGGDTLGQTYRATWKDVPNEEGDAAHAGYIYLTLTEDGSEILSFEASDTLLYEDGSLREARVQGRGVPRAEDAADPGQFLLTGEDVCEALSAFDQDWFFADGNSREVTRFQCDEYSVLRITIR